MAIAENPYSIPHHIKSFNHIFDPSLFSAVSGQYISIFIGDFVDELATLAHDLLGLG